MRRTAVALLLITWLRTTAGSDPGSDRSPPHDPDGATRASDPDSPWIDLAPSRVLDAREEPVHARAVVRWVRRFFRPRGMGLEFIDVEGLGQTRLESWIDSVLV